MNCTAPSSRRLRRAPALCVGRFASVGAPREATRRSGQSERNASARPPTARVTALARALGGGPMPRRWQSTTARRSSEIGVASTRKGGVAKFTLVARDAANSITTKSVASFSVVRAPNRLRSLRRRRGLCAKASARLSVIQRASRRVHAARVLSSCLVPSYKYIYIYVFIALRYGYINVFTHQLKFYAHFVISLDHISGEVLSAGVAWVRNTQIAPPG